MSTLRILAAIPLLVVLASNLAAQEFTSSPANGASGASRAPVRVFLLAGQSNAEGLHTDVEEVDNFPPFVGAADPQPDVLFWYETAAGNSSGGWIPLQPELERGILGPELTFARAVKARTLGPIAIIKSTRGGTNLAVDWDPDNTSGAQMYERTLTLMQTALASFVANNIPWRLEGVLWQQGENDMLDDTYVTEYGARLTALIDRLRTDLGEPDLDWFVGETSFKGIWGISYRSNMQTLRSEQLAVVDADPNVFFVPTSHLAFKINTDQKKPHYHFGTEGQLQLGEAHAAAYLGTLGIDVVHESEAFCCDFPAASGSTVRVFVLAGQRSMDGEQAYVERIGDYPYFATLAELQHDVAYRYRLGGGSHTSTDWAPLGPADYLGNFGPELSFGQVLDAELDDPIAVIKITDGAAFLEDWLPSPTDASRPQYDDAIDFIQDALADLQNRGLNPVLEAVMWLPGEHDAWWSPFRSSYATNLSTLVGSMRADLATPDLEWYVAELADSMIWGESKLDELDAQIESVADVDPLLWFIESDTVPTPDQSATFETEGVLYLGELLAESYLQASGQ